MTTTGHARLGHVSKTNSMNGSGPIMVATPSVYVCKELPVEGSRAEVEEVDKAFIENLKKYVLTHTKVISEKEMDDLPVKQYLGQGSFGSVDLVTFKGLDAIRKAVKYGRGPTGFLWESRVTLEVDGTGGAPCLHALCTEPAIAVMDYAGVPLHQITYFGCIMGTFLRIVAGLAESLAEVHAKGFVHNDIKCDKHHGDRKRH